jgi:hypothetical protein
MNYFLQIISTLNFSNITWKIHAFTMFLIIDFQKNISNEAWGYLHDIFLHKFSVSSFNFQKLPPWDRKL